MNKLDDTRIPKKSKMSYKQGKLGIKISYIVLCRQVSVAIAKFPNKV